MTTAYSLKEAVSRALDWANRVIKHVDANKLVDAEIDLTWVDHMLACADEALVVAVLVSPEDCEDAVRKQVHLDIAVCRDWVASDRTGLALGKGLLRTRSADVAGRLVTLASILSVVDEHRLPPLLDAAIDAAAREGSV